MLTKVDKHIEKIGMMNTGMGQQIAFAPKLFLIAFSSIIIQMIP